jgi:hypothetical protein
VSVSPFWFPSVDLLELPVGIGQQEDTFLVGQVSRDWSGCFRTTAASFG